jgi:hypothetical protein
MRLLTFGRNQRSGGLIGWAPPFFYGQNRTRVAEIDEGRLMSRTTERRLTTHRHSLFQVFDKPNITLNSVFGLSHDVRCP